MVDDLLDVARISQGKINLQLERLDLKTVMKRAIEISRPRIDARKHDLRVSLPEQALEVEGDAVRLVQVVANLLNNSAKYTQDGGRIDLEVEAIGGQAVVRVRDTGIGIEPAMLPKVFDLFTQVKGSLGLAGGGLGIGLALVRNTIEVHGGWVQAASAGLGHGSEFVVRLPLLRQMPALAPTPPERPWGVVDETSRRILLIDDNVDLADSMAILLRFAGHEVTIAYDGRTGLDLARVQLPEVVICDITMPHMSGLEVARHLRENLGLHDALLVAMSGYGQEKDRHLSQEAGFDAHLVKPVQLASLKTILASPDFQSPRPAGVAQDCNLSPLIRR
jgi:CheY-like chemotaxis protein/anti-sigma regulatory factor (Ser/Thr protein kinase)